jgi:ABC-type nitrate/sulfonate/bicarbonate transport system permease component
VAVLIKKLIGIENIKRKKGSLKSTLLLILVFTVIISVWQILVEGGFIAKYILPSPYDILITFFDIFPDVLPHMLISLKEAVIGLFFAIIFSILLALLMDNIKLLKDMVYPVLVVSQTVPIILLAPLFAIWFGFGQLPKIIIVVLVCFFPVVISLYEGLSSIDRSMVNLLKSMGANRLQIFRLLKFPASLISFFSGLRIAVTYCILAAVIGEWMGGDKGLGVLFNKSKECICS